MIASAPDMAQKTEGSVASTSRACSNEGSGENKCSHSEPESIGSICVSMQPIHYRCRL